MHQQPKKMLHCYSAPTPQKLRINHIFPPTQPWGEGCWGRSVLLHVPKSQCGVTSVWPDVTSLSYTKLGCSQSIRWKQETEDGRLHLQLMWEMVEWQLALTLGRPAWNQAVNLDLLCRHLEWQQCLCRRALLGLSAASMLWKCCCSGLGTISEHLWFQLASDCVEITGSGLITSIWSRCRRWQPSSWWKTVSTELLCPSQGSRQAH